MAIEPVKIPQNVYIEDRIVGPLTLRQIIIVTVGCGFSYAVWASLSKAYGNLGIFPTIVLFIPGALSFLFAFVEINDLSLLRLLLLYVEKMSKPNVRVWAPREGIKIHIRTFTPQKEDKKRKQPEQQTRIEELTGVLDSPARVLPRSSIMDGVRAPQASTGAAEPMDIDDTALPALRISPGDIAVDPLDASQAVDGIRGGSQTGPLFRDLSPA